MAAARRLRELAVGDPLHAVDQRPSARRRLPARPRRRRCGPRSSSGPRARTCSCARSPRASARACATVCTGVRLGPTFTRAPASHSEASKSRHTRTGPAPPTADSIRSRCSLESTITIGAPTGCSRVLRASSCRARTVDARIGQQQVLEAGPECEPQGLRQGVGELAPQPRVAVQQQPLHAPAAQRLRRQPDRLAAHTGEHLRRVGVHERPDPRTRTGPPGRRTPAYSGPGEPRRRGRPRALGLCWSSPSRRHYRRAAAGWEGGRGTSA